MLVEEALDDLACAWKGVWKKGVWKNGGGKQKKEGTSE
jgi:hypothetical protein